MVVEEKKQASGEAKLDYVEVTNLIGQPAYVKKEYVENSFRFRLKEKLYDQTQEPCYTEDFTLRLQRRELQDALQCLTPAEQRLVYLAAGQRTPWKSLGKAFRSPVSTLYGRYKRALDKVRKGLEE